MKDRTQMVGWIILFLIASGFIGFSGAWFFIRQASASYWICAVSLMICVFSLLLLVYWYMLKNAHRQALWAMLKRGCYHEVDRCIDIHGKDMKQLWELKMLACFHSGDRSTFDQLYNSYMNEINECKTLGTYMLFVLRELLDALSHDKPPAVFLKNDAKKRSYTKQREYQLYYQIQAGIQEYYGTQKQLMKIYFEKFIIQTDVLSKPLGFYLYYLMTSVMVENDHPQWEDYYRKTQQYIFDEESLRYAEKLKTQIYGIQKGTGNQELMNRDMNRTRRNNPLFEDNQSQSLNRSFNYQQPSFRREREEVGMDARRHSADIQKEFDEMNSSLNEGNTFSLYEDDEMNLLNQKRRGAAASEPVLPQEEPEDDLDPTWFARRSMEANQPAQQSQAYQRQTPTVSEAANAYSQQEAMSQNPMGQDPMMRSFGYQDDTASYNRNYQNRAENEAPAFVNRRTQPEQRSNQDAQLNRPINQRTEAQAFYANRNIPNQRDMSSQQRVNPQQQNAYSMQQPYEQRMQRNEQDEIQAEAAAQPYQAYPDAQPNIEESQMQKRAARKQSKKDPFAFSEDHQASRKAEVRKGKRSEAKKASANESVLMEEQQPYRTYVRHNIIIFFITLLDAALVSVATASVVYTNFFKRYSSINSDIVTDIILMSLLVTLIAAYLTAAIHTGFTILKKSIRNWKTPLKVILSPILLVISLLIGVICEIPYLIYASVKKGKE